MKKTLLDICINYLEALEWTLNTTLQVVVGPGVINIIIQFYLLKYIPY